MNLSQTTGSMNVTVLTAIVSYNFLQLLCWDRVWNTILNGTVDFRKAFIFTELSSPLLQVCCKETYMWQNTCTDHLEHLYLRCIFISALQTTSIEKLFYLEMPLSFHPWIRDDLRCLKRDSPFSFYNSPSWKFEIIFKKQRNMNPVMQAWLIITHNGIWFFFCCNGNKNFPLARLIRKDVRENICIKFQGASHLSV